MGYTGEPLLDGSHHDLCRCFAVAGRHADAGGRKLAQKTLRHLLGCERDERAAGAGEIGQPVKVADVRNGDMVRPVDAGPRRADERTLQVDAEHAAAAGRRACRRDGGLCLLPRIGDQRRQARRRPVTPMRAGDGPHALRRRLVVEQSPAAAVDLEVDETGSQYGVVRQSAQWPSVRNLPRRRQPADAAVLDHHRGVAVPATAVENAVPEHRVATVACDDLLTLLHLERHPIGLA
jgi:hypothetical protein